MCRDACHTNTASLAGSLHEIQAFVPCVYFMSHRYGCGGLLLIEPVSVPRVRLRGCLLHKLGVMLRILWSRPLNLNQQLRLQAQEHELVVSPVAFQTPSTTVVVPKATTWSGNRPNAYAWSSASLSHSGTHSYTGGQRPHAGGQHACSGSTGRYLPTRAGKNQSSCSGRP